MTPVLNPNSHQLATTAQASPRRLHVLDLELALFATCLALLALGIWGPSVKQPSVYHAFADQRLVFGVPNMMDVLSNLMFAGFGLVGTWRIWRAPQGVVQPGQKCLGALFFFGLLMTAVFSSWYHLQPDDPGLAIDRYGMTIAFAGLLGLAAATRVSDRAGQWLAFAALVCGAWSIWTWSAGGNVLPWAVLQFGGIALVLGMGSLPARADALPVSWISVILIYALAKLLEHADAQVYQLTHTLVSGHTLKHIVASCAALPVLAALARVGCPLESSARNATVAAKR